MTTQTKQKVTQKELAKLAGHLGYIKGMVEIERKISPKESYYIISETMEKAIAECVDIAERLVFKGIEEVK